ncbi:hypothetical protein [Streptomyces olivaceus]|uniref:hypothetical protein n=1 Tax=Streptomyces olivaceus TaxID=47716 RepID=UPI0036309590
MSESWGAVVAAATGGILGIAGTFTGLFIGRRQTTDQASVEHLQWLRDQRAEAYVSFLAAWDSAVTSMHNHTLGLIPRPPGETAPTPRERMERVTTEVIEPVKALDPLYERVQLLGPEAAATAATEMRQAASSISSDLVVYASQGPQEGETLWTGFAARITMLHEPRATFFLVARAQLMTAPRPKG